MERLHLPERFETDAGPLPFYPSGRGAAHLQALGTVFYSGRCRFRPGNGISKNRGAYKPPCPGRKGITPRIKGEPSNGENPQKAKSESIGFRKRRPARPFLPAAHGGSRRGGQKRRAMAEGRRQAQFCPAEALCRIPPPNPCRMSGSFYRYSACLCSGDLCRRPRICGSARGLGGSRRGC